IHYEMRSAGWAWPVSQWLGHDLCEKTLGLVGLGRIGRNLARMAGAGFRMRLLGFDPYVSEEIMSGMGVQKCNRLSDLLSIADFVSLPAVLTPETRHLIGRKELEQMKPSAVLINVSRGALVDETALIDSLETHRIAGAGLDVFSQEPLSTPEHPFKSLLTQ